MGDLVGSPDLDIVDCGDGADVCALGRLLVHSLAGATPLACGAVGQGDDASRSVEADGARTVGHQDALQLPAQPSRADRHGGVHLHDLRHFYASALVAAGCDVVTVQRALGHSSARITLNTYSHLWPTAEDRTRTAATDLMREVLDVPRTTVLRTRCGLAADHKSLTCAR